MRQDALARRNEPDARPASGLPAEGRSTKAEYEALCAALGASARGRAFLDEHARRARKADTALAIEALTRLEVLLRQRDEDADAKARLRSELRALLAAIASARTNFDRFEGTLAKRETVMALFDMLEQRVTEILTDAPAEIEPPANENEVVEQPSTPFVEAAAPIYAHPSERGDPEPKSLESENAALGPRLRGDERKTEAPQSTLMQAAPEPDTFPTEIFAPAPAQHGDIIARINALTPAEKIALFS